MCCRESSEVPANVQPLGFGGEAPEPPPQEQHYHYRSKRCNNTAKSQPKGQLTARGRVMRAHSERLTQVDIPGRNVPLAQGFIRTMVELMAPGR